MYYCESMSSWFLFVLYSQTHAAYPLCKILNAIPFAYIYMINQSPDLINILQYKIAGLWYLKTFNPRHLLCLLQWYIINYEFLLSSMFNY
jgi:hypothetical protein